MSAVPLTAKQMIEDYFTALSGNPKTESLIDQFVDDASLKQHILQAEASFPNYELIPSQIVCEGDMVAVNSTVNGTHKRSFAGIDATGKTVSAGAMMFYQITNGRIAKFWMQFDVMSVINQLKNQD